MFREPDGYSEFRKPATKARADDTDQGERLGGVHAVLYPPAIAVLKQGEGEGGGFGIKDGIKQAGRKGKVLVRQRTIAGFDPSRPSQPVGQSPTFPRERKKGPQTAGFCDIAAGLQFPISVF